MKVRALEREQVLPAETDRVFEFFADAHHLEARRSPDTNQPKLTPRPEGR